MALLNESFDDLSLFYENDSTVIFKGVSKNDGKRVILKSHKNQDEMYRIKHEYDLLAGKNIPGVTNVLDISYNDDKNYLVLEDTGAIVLDDYIEQHPMDTGTFLKVARNAAAALSSIHGEGIVHCDIKPANILIHPETLQIWYIDFGISFSMHSRDSRLEGFAGTLEYMAPEQTGRLNMTVDLRSDLYSLGITFYYILSKRLPFAGESAVELIHAHTVLPPAPLAEHTDTEPVIADLIGKLMEKPQHKRYQSADSLIYDLERCAQLLEESGSIASFALGERDVFASLEPGRKLYGKESTLEEMLGVFHSTPRNASSLLLLHGPAESGKSSLLATFEEYVQANNGYLLKGVFDWRESPESYSAIRETFEGFERYAYNANLPLPEYRTRILEALGANAQVLIDILPSFASILGEQPPVKKLNPLESQERARRAFEKTIEILCDAPYPYVFIFENMQWADYNSIDLLLSAVEGRNVGNCIMVFCYRDDDPAFLGQLTSRLQSLDRKGLSITDLPLTHLTREDVGQLVSDLFDQDSLQSRELEDILYQATGGVLSKIRTYLQLMYRSKQIQYDPAEESWTVHLENLDTHVLQDIESRYQQELDQLSPGLREVLARLACMGEDFELGDTASAFDLEPAALEADVRTLESGGWVVADAKFPGRYYFTHSTIYGLCSRQLEQQARDRLHRQAVERLYERYRERPEEMLGHSTLFTRLILSSDRGLYADDLLKDIARCKITAAEEFMAAANVGQAARVFENGLRLLGDDPFELSYDLAYELYLNYAMCAFALHEDGKALSLFEIVLENAKDEGDRYNAYYKIVNQYLTTAEWDLAKLYCKRYLSSEGLLLSDGRDYGEAGDQEYERFRQLTGRAGIELCVSFPQTDDPLEEHHGNMLAMLADALLFSLDETKCKYYLYRAINFAVENKRVFSEFARAFCVGAARYATVGDFPKAKWLIETGLKYAEKNQAGQAFLWCVYGNMITHWVNPLEETPEIYKQAKHHALMEGNAFYEAYADMILLNHHSFIGENLEDYHREAQATLHNLERSRLSALQANFKTFRQYARCLMGRTKSPDSFDDAQFREETLEEIRGTWNGSFNDNFYFVYRLRSLYIHGYCDLAVEYAEKFAELSSRLNMSAYITQVQFHYYYCMALLDLCRLHPENKESYLRTIQEHKERLAHYARINPDNFESKHLLVKTGLQGLTQDNIELVDSFAAAHRHFEGKGMLWDAAFVERLIGNFWQKRNIPQYVAIHKKNALRYYKTIGARHLVRLMADLDDAPEPAKRSSRTQHTVHTHIDRTFFQTQLTRNENSQYTGINMALDFQALLHVLEDLIKMDTLPLLAGELLTLLLQNGSAQKALLFLENGSGTSLYAVKYAIDSQGDFNETELPLELALVEDDLVPKKLIELAKTKEKTLSANSSRNEYRTLGDSYLKKANPESFLCMPIDAKGKHLGVIYLENASLAGSFPEGRVRFLQSIALQASVLILNLQNVSTMEEYTKDLERRLSSYLGQQNALIAGIAHEINSPVGVCLTVATKVYEKTQSVIAALGKKALSKGALDKYLEETREGLNIINNNIMRAGDLVQNFKKMSVEQSTEVFENLELAPTIRNIVEYIRPGVKKKIDQINIDVPEDLWFNTSSGVLAQIFTNLIMNSAIHGFEGMEKDGCRVNIHIEELENRDAIEIRYSDNGKGMTEEEQSKIFQPFYTTKRNRGGSGLGGHIVLTHVTQTLKGSVRCISAPGEGTTFVLRLPKNRQDQVKELPLDEQ